MVEVVVDALRNAMAIELFIGGHMFRPWPAANKFLRGFFRILLILHFNSITECLVGVMYQPWWIDFIPHFIKSLFAPKSLFWSDETSMENMR